MSKLKKNKRRGDYLQQEAYRISVKASASDIDLFGHMRLSALLQIMQNMATEHAEILGFGGTFMQEQYNAFWLMARTSLSFTQSITAKDELEIYTTHRGVGKGVTIFRDYDFYVDGKQIGQATTAWVLVEITQKKIMKPTGFAELVTSAKPEKLKEVVPEKVRFPEVLEDVMTRTCTYSDTDINRHMNNTKYADIALDALGFEQFAGQYIADVQINYLTECFPGNTLSLCTAQQTDKASETSTHFVLGKHENEEACFAFRLQMRGETV